jgi:hypothetical protein
MDDFEDFDGPLDGQRVGIDEPRLVGLADALRHLLDTQGLADARHSRYIFMKEWLHRL